MSKRFKDFIKRIATVNPKIKIIDNPFSNLITVEGPASETNAIKVYNMKGTDVTGLTKVIDVDSSYAVLDGSKLSNGIYLLKTTTSTHKIYKTPA